MKVLIIGNGGREHAIAWKFAASKCVNGLFVAPGNGGTAAIAQNLAIDPFKHAEVIKAVVEKEINLVFVGPEVPLADGLVDSLEAAGIAAIGPRRECAQLESSKSFTKAFLQRNNIPTAAYQSFSDKQAFLDYIDAHEGLRVVKKSGLAAGKGVLESADKAELKDFGAPFLERDGDTVVVEEFLKGFEVSIFTLSDGVSYKILPPATDYKKSGENNAGLNTGGMGAISPVPWLEKAMMNRIESEVVEPVFAALRKEGLMYKGLLYFGLMITAEGPKVLEFNVRFGDPEAQVLIPRITNDFCTLFQAVAEERLAGIELQIDERTALGVVVAAPGYPGDYPKNLEVKNTFSNHDANRILFHSGSKLEDGVLKTNGGRCFTCVGLGKDIEQARHYAYSLTEELSFDGAWVRKDIGANIYNY